MKQDDEHTLEHKIEFGTSKIIFIILYTLKAFNIIDIQWLWVTSPLWIPEIIDIFVFLLIQCITNMSGGEKNGP